VSAAFSNDEIPTPPSVPWPPLEQTQVFPELGSLTGDRDIRQLVVRFGSSGYIVRYAILADSGDILVTRIWHGREARE
jgi:ParE toxin of type II toxin-antitoxin system, parDE